MEEVSVLIIGAGTAGSNTARSALLAGAKRVVMVHTPELINTCVEEGCMPSKSVLAGARCGEEMSTVLETKNQHINRLRTALTDSFAADKLEIVVGNATFISEHEVLVEHGGTATTFSAEAIVIATGSHSYVPAIPGLDTLGERLLLSEDVVGMKADFKETPKRILTIGAGPIGLELSTFFHDMGSSVTVLQRGALLRAFDPEFGEERLAASKDAKSFPIICNATLTKTEVSETGVLCTIKENDEERVETYDYVLIATGRTPNLESLSLPATIQRDERANLVINEEMQTSLPHIYAAGDVVGHHQILHYAAEMGKVAGHNAAGGTPRSMEYDRFIMAVSFDEYPSALIGLTEKEATDRGIEVVTATRNFNSIGLGILKRQQYGLWKLVAEKATGKILGSQVLGPGAAGELVQLLSPVMANNNTAADIVAMTWYHPTYAEILLSLARDIEKQRL